MKIIFIKTGVGSRAFTLKHCCVGYYIKPPYPHMLCQHAKSLYKNDASANNELIPSTHHL